MKVAAMGRIGRIRERKVWNKAVKRRFGECFKEMFAGFALFVAFIDGHGLFQRRYFPDELLDRLLLLFVRVFQRLCLLRFRCICLMLKQQPLFGHRFLHKKVYLFLGRDQFLLHSRMFQTKYIHLVQFMLHILDTPFLIRTNPCLLLCRTLFDSHSLLFVRFFQRLFQKNCILCTAFLQFCCIGVVFLLYIGIFCTKRQIFFE